MENLSIDGDDGKMAADSQAGVLRKFTPTALNRHNNHFERDKPTTGGHQQESRAESPIKNRWNESRAALLRISISSVLVRIDIIVPSSREGLIKLAALGATALVAGAVQYFQGAEVAGLVGVGIALLGTASDASFGHLGLEFVHDVARRLGVNQTARGRENRDLHRLIGETIACILEKSVAHASSDFGAKWLKHAAGAFRGEDWMSIELQGPETTASEPAAVNFFSGDAELIKKTQVLSEADWFVLVEKVYAPTQTKESDEALKNAAAQLHNHFALELWETAKDAWKTNDLAWPALILRLLTELLGKAVVTADELPKLRDEIITLRTAIARHVAPAINSAQPSDALLVQAIHSYQAMLASQLDRIEVKLDTGFTIIRGDIADLRDALTKPAVERSDPSMIIEKTRDFVGRRWLDERLDSFFGENSRGYFVIQGLPGMGKTAYAAHLVATRNYVHHFNDRLAGITSSRHFLYSLSPQLIRKHNLPLQHPTETDCQDGVYLRRLLDTLGAQLKTENAVEVIVVDAVDEVEPNPDHSNILHLPPALPAGVFFVLTRREVADFPLHVQPPSLTMTLEDQAGNTDDIVEFLTAVARRPSLSSQLRDRRIEEKEFIQLLQGKAENNFMYLACVVPQIERGDYTGEFSVELPQGLAGYYEQHWRRLRRLQGDRWASALPIICVLAVAKEPLSIQEIHEYVSHGFPELAGLTRMDVRQLTRVWREFLWESREDDRSQFRIYHSSFKEFLEKQDEIGEEINLRAAHGWIADTLWDAWSTGSSGELPKG